MADFYQQFLRSSQAMGAIQADIQQRQLRADVNRRENEAAAAQQQEIYRLQQATERVRALREASATAGDPLTSPADDATRRLNTIMSEGERYRKTADIMEDAGQYKLANVYRDDARAQEQHELDQRVKTVDLHVKEADSVASVYQSITDDASLLQAASMLMRMGKREEADGLLEVSGGRYSEALAPLIKSKVDMSLTGKEKLDFEHKTLTQAQTARNQRAMRNDAQLRIQQTNERIALSRDRLEAKKGPTTASIREDYKVLKKEAPTDRELEDLREAATPAFDFGAEPDPKYKPEAYKAWAEAKAKQDRVKDFETYKASLEGKTPPAKEAQRKDPVVPTNWNPPKGSRFKRSDLTHSNIMRVVMASQKTKNPLTYEQVLKNLGLSQ